ncbi:hypothetical protein [Halodesulfovibrio marinisediminis]|uniref:Uncharacterized protein n=1 Tax=Halodesulfovibrio marinisediminis DSM 17456 TaxID=1121457 RepID=A0A1N6I158_9BACT|nr:hypothetical protein [Halodesulfovibrio marinisediminis]SIO25645.1 hypothetical protein SAMN02745161_2327 [Halodesulfovibrio marinisediminis DSM 17456]
MTAKKESITEVGGAIAPLFNSAEVGKTTKAFRSLGEEADATSERLDSVKGVGRMERLNKVVGKTANSAKWLYGKIGGLLKIESKFAGVNAMTAQQVTLARSLGVSAKGLETWEGLASSAGLSAGSAGKMIKEMNEKFGKAKISGKDKAFGGAFKELGLSLKELESMSPEQKFMKITSALKEMGDQDKAKSLAQQIFSGDGSQFIGSLQKTKVSLETLYNEQAKLSVLTEEGRQGSEKYSNAMSSISTVVSSVKAEFCGLMGGALEPYVKNLAPKIGELFNEHRGNIKKFGQMIGAALPKIAEVVFSLVGVLTSAGSAIGSVFDSFGGFGAVAAEIGGALEQTIKTLGPKIGALINEHKDDIKKFGQMLGEALPKIGEFALSLLGVLASVGSVILKVIDAVGGFGTVAAVVGGVMSAKFAFSGYKMVKTIWDIGQAVAPLASSVLPHLGSVFVGVGKSIGSVATGVLPYLGSMLGGISQAIVPLASNALPLLGSMFASVGSTLASIGSTVFPMLLTGLRTITAAFMSNPIGLAIGLIGFAIGRVFTMWDDLKKAFMEGGVLKAIGTFFGFGGDDEEEKEKKSKTRRVVGDSVSKEFVTQDGSDAVGYSISGEKVPRYNSKELIPKPVPMASSTETKQLNDNRNVTINVYASEGQSSKEVAQSVHAEFMNTSGEMFDYA